MRHWDGLGHAFVHGLLPDSMVYDDFMVKKCVGFA